jgi:predicted DNA-binding transcriptional regulator AlpA
MPLDHIAQDPPDELVPDPEVCREFNVTPMTLWRWDRDEKLSFPPPVRIRHRNFRSRRQLEAFKTTLIKNAMDARDARRGNAHA